LKNIWPLTLLYLVFVLDLREKKKSFGKQANVRKLMVGFNFNDKNYEFHSIRDVIDILFGPHLTKKIY